MAVCRRYCECRTQPPKESIMLLKKVTLAALAGTVLLAAAPVFADNGWGDRQQFRGNHFQGDPGLLRLPQTQQSHEANRPLHPTARPESDRLQSFDSRARTSWTIWADSPTVESLVMSRHVWPIPSRAILRARFLTLRSSIARHRARSRRNSPPSLDAPRYPDRRS